MRKVLVAGLTVAMMASAFSTAYAGGDTRKVTREYSTPNGVSAATFEARSTSIGDTLKFRAGPGEHSVTFEVKDALGQAVRAYVNLDRNQDGTVESTRAFCNQSKPLDTKPGMLIVLEVVVGTCGDTRPSVASSGAVTATFTR